MSIININLSEKRLNNVANYKNILIMFLFITPFIDISNGLVGQGNSLGPGQLIRTAFMIYLIVIIVRFNNKSILLFLFFSGSLLLSQLFYSFSFGGSLNTCFSNLVFDLRLLFTLVMIIGLITFLKDDYEIREKIFSFLEFSLGVISIVIILGYLFHFGYNTYTLGNESGVGSKGLFLGQNDLSAVISMIFPIVFSRLVSNKGNRIKKLIIMLLALLSAVLLGTKGVLISISLTFLFFVINLLIKGKIIKLFLTFIIFIFTLIVILILFTNYQTSFYNWLNYQAYFLNKSDSLITYLLGGRNHTLQPTFKIFMDNPLSLFLGTSFVGGQEMLTNEVGYFSFVEFDPMSVLFYNGIIVFLFFFIILSFFGLKSIKLLKGNDIDRSIFLSFWAICLNSILGGHVVASGIAGTFLATACFLVYSYTKQKLIV